MRKRLRLCVAVVAVIVGFAGCGEVYDHYGNVVPTYIDKAGNVQPLGPTTTMPPEIAAECYVLGYQDGHPCFELARSYGWATEPWYP